MHITNLTMFNDEIQGYYGYTTDYYTVGVQTLFKQLVL